MVSLSFSNVATLIIRLRMYYVKYRLLQLEINIADLNFLKCDEKL